jgi:very-short-patch-repair endonuclease
LRRTSTDAEWRLWHKVKNRQLMGLKFVRQFPVGPYIADFACRERGLIVEVDGGQHSGSKSDAVRDRYLNDAGYSVLRFWNDEVLRDTDVALTVLIEVLEGRPSPGWRFAPATLSPEGRGKEEQ